MNVQGFTAEVRRANVKTLSEVDYGKYFFNPLTSMHVKLFTEKVKKLFNVMTVKGLRVKQRI